MGQMCDIKQKMRQQLDELLVRDEATRRQNAVMTLLHETALALIQRPKIDEVLSVIASKATEMIGTPHGFIRLVDEEEGIFYEKIGLGYYAQNVGRKIKLTDGLSGQVYKSGKIAIVEDYSTWGNRLDDPFFDQVHGIAHVPLKAGDKVVGTFGLAFLEPERKFSEQDISFLSRFADLAAIALSNAQLISSLTKSEKELQKKNEEFTAANEELLASEEELRQQLDELLQKEYKIQQQNAVLSSLHDTVLALMHRLDLDDVLKEIISNAGQLLGATDCYINLVDEKEKVYVRKVGLGRFAQDMTRQTPVTAGLLGQAYKTGQIAVVNNYSTWEHRISEPIFDGLHCCLVVPLKIGDKVIGAFGLCLPEPGQTAGEHEISLLQRFADIAAIAVDNAFLVTSYKNELEERKRAEETIKTSEEKYRAIFEAANDGIYIHDIETGAIWDVNDRACKMYGYTREEMIWGDLSLLGTGEYPYTESEARKWIKSACVSPQLFEWKNRHRDGRYVWVEINLQRVMIGNKDCILAIVRDISERKAQEQAIRQLAYSDPLTGLPNRTYLKEYLDSELAKASRGESAGAVLFIDLDDLKTVNDTFGHSQGDNVIVKAGNYIVAEAGPRSLVVRIGGDEFIVVLQGKYDRREVISIADNMVKALGREYDTSNGGTYLSASVGIALYPENGATAEDILRNADLALYAAKRSGKNIWRLYEDTLQKTAYEDMLLKQRLREAEKRNELSLHYQPLVDARTFTVVGFEALLRWTSAELGPIPPGRFIPLAEESEIIQTIGKWVINEACQFARKLTKMGKGDIRVSVNVSPRQLMAKDFVSIIYDAVNGTGISPNQLEIEITENTIISSIKEITQKLHDLREFGVRLSLDDFGCGYCSLTYLNTLPVGTLKIDKSFIDKIEYEETQLCFVNSIINMAHVQRLSVVAEGIETETQLNKLIECQCDCIQGYLFSKPMPADEAILFLKKDRENG